MKKFLTICLVGAFALAAASCSDKKEGNGSPDGTITVDGTAEKVGSAFYGYENPDEFDEGCWTILLCRQIYSGIPTAEPECYIGIEISDSCIGKTTDLTKRLAQSGTKTPYIGIAIPGRFLEIDDDSAEVYLNDDDDLSGITVTSGSLLVTRDGDKFTVRLDVKFSDGVSAAANWGGTATKVAM